MPITEPRLYAVVDNSVALRKEPRKKRQTKVEVKAQKNDEFELKRHIDRADHLLTRHEARIAGLASQIARLQKTKAHLAARKERIEDAILQRMQDHNMHVAAGWKISLIANTCPASVEIVNESLLPKEYVRIKETTSPDKSAIRIAIDAGIEIPGARLYQRISLQRK